MKMTDKIERINEKYGDMETFLNSVPMGEMTTDEMLVVCSLLGQNHGAALDGLEERISEIERVLTCQEYDGEAVSAYG